MTDLQFIASIGGAILILLGTLYTVRATRGRTKSDYKTAFEKRIDEKMMGYTEGLERRLALNEQKLTKAENAVIEANDAAGELKERVEHLEEMQEESTKREASLYRYTARLRNHIINGLQPPPPEVPEELMEWFANFEAGQGLA